MLRQKHKGPGIARNLGAKNAKGEILIFVDADMAFHKDYLKNLIKPILEDKKGEVIGTTHELEIVNNLKNIWSRCWGKVRVSKKEAENVKIFRAIRKNKFLRTNLVTRDIREAIRRAGYSWRPYVLRAYFDTNMIIAESKGKVSHPYLQFMMGHKGDIEARYSTNKGVLPPDMIEDMRKCYKGCLPYLLTTTQPLEQSTVVTEAKIEALKSIAKTLLGIDLVEVKIAKEKELGRELSKEEEIQLFEEELKKIRENPDPQKIVREEELEKYLEDGWQFVSVLPSKRILIRKELALG